jgi:GDP-4-dehydro-6-deoxy-D-mannose reductase
VKAVVTGANGFAGQWLCRSLVAHGRPVEGWVRHVPGRPIDGVDYRIVDVREREQCQDGMGQAKPTEVYHLAAMTHLRECDQNAHAAVQTNVEGTRNLFASMPDGAMGLFASTCHVYGRPQELPISERHPLCPEGVYARTKQSAESAVLALGKNVVIARSFHHTGPGQDERYALADWSAQVRRGAHTVKVGDLSLRRDYCDVRDIVEGYRLLCIHGKPDEAYNLCSGESFTLGEMFDWISEGTVASTEPDEHRMRIDDVPEFRGNPQKAERLGWVRAWPLRRTLCQMSTRAT